ncbi:MAG: PD-(D/E)XK nuclease family protein [Planktothrix sp.]|uniref:PD-(D/E)XK nuclease family protein n=1 Tax=Planktothrix sp. TaxID=3088171 RepID=UPI0038D37688
MTRFRLSQQHLNLLSLCPRKFQYTYLDQLVSPVSPDDEERIAWGNQFHLLMQQHELGLPVEVLLNEDTELKRCYTEFIKVASDILTLNADASNSIFRQAEHDRILNFKDDLLVVVYDLIKAEKQQAQIFDWKTYPRPQNRHLLEQNWQTRLYLYVLVETSQYLPEQVSMTYWFVKSPQKQPPQSLYFPYTQQQHQKTYEDLTQLIDQFHHDLNLYQQGQPFPQVDLEQGYCKSCQFAIRCQRVPDELSVNELIDSENLYNIDQIQEVKIP